MNKLKIIFVSIILTRCALPQFSFKSGGSEAKEINAKTVQVDYFDNKSAIGGSFLDMKRLHALSPAELLSESTAHRQLR